MRICDSAEKFEENDGLTTRATNSYSKIVEKKIIADPKIQKYNPKNVETQTALSLASVSPTATSRNHEGSMKLGHFLRDPTMTPPPPVFMQGVGVFGVGNGDQRW